MNKMIFSTKILSLAFFLSSFIVLSQDESTFYKETINKAVRKNIVTDYGAIPNDNRDDSPALRRAIAQLTRRPNGGRIYFPKGSYRLKFINMRSNIHLVFHKEAIIKLPNGDNPWGAVFDFGITTSAIRNVSIRGEGGQFRIDQRGAANGEISIAFKLGKVTNFKIDNVRIIDNLTAQAAVVVANPTKGIVKNMSIVGAAFGYGLVQLASGKNLLFKNLRGVGGTTLRFEPGITTTVGGQNLVARNITCVNGNAAFMLSPHSAVFNGIDVKGVTSRSCGFGLRIERGFGTRGRGYAKNVKIKDVNIIFGRNAQVRVDHREFVHCAFKHLIAPRPTIVTGSITYYKSPSAAPADYFGRAKTRYSDGFYPVNISSTRFSGFHSSTKFSGNPRYKAGNCNGRTFTGKEYEGKSNDIETVIKAFPNPFSNILMVKTPQKSVHAISLHDIHGKILITKNVSDFNNKTFDLETETLEKGSYILKISGENYSKELIVIKK